MSRIVIFLVFLLLASCTPDEKPQVAFYYWKTRFNTSDFENKVLAKNNVSNLYVRYFDVVMRNGKPFPISPATMAEVPPGVSIVPVVYIKNEVMTVADLDVRALAKKIDAYLQQINQRYAIKTTALQIDCDWTLKTRETYFGFLRELKTIINSNLSATIRLHQVKYHYRTGIPPVDRGVLMYYNMGSIAADSSNSIYERVTARQYVKSLSTYPLTLDIALPIFTWGIHIRDGRVIGLINKTTSNNFTGDENFLYEQENLFKANRSIIKAGYYYEAGDNIKIESVSPAELKEMAEDIAGEIANTPHEIIFYDLDELNLLRYDDEKNIFEEVCGVF